MRYAAELRELAHSHRHAPLRKRLLELADEFEQLAADWSPDNSGNGPD